MTLFCVQTWKENLHLKTFFHLKFVHDVGFVFIQCFNLWIFIWTKLSNKSFFNYFIVTVLKLTRSAIFATCIASWMTSLRDEWGRLSNYKLDKKFEFDKCKEYLFLTVTMALSITIAVSMNFWTALTSRLSLPWVALNIVMTSRRNEFFESEKMLRS